MNKLYHIKSRLFAIIMCISLMLCGCGSSEQTKNTTNTTTAEGSTSAVEAVTDVENAEPPEEETTTVTTTQASEKEPEEVIIDYGDAESFEAALNEGKNLEGKIVRFEAQILYPDSAFGYNVVSGEHLNFVSSRNPDVQVGDTVTVKITTIESVLGSWIINYENVDNAVMGEETITSSKPKETETTTKETTTTTKKTETTTTSKATEKPKTETTAPEYTGEDTYEHNQYFDVVEGTHYKNIIGYTIVVHKVLAKKNVSLSSTLIAYGNDNAVIGKSTDEIILTEGQYNFFCYTFEGDVENATISANVSKSNNDFLAGERNAVEMVQYNRSGDDLYITLQQTGDSLGSFAKFKLLLYKGDQIVDTEDCYFSICAANLNGKGSTDVAKIWVYGTDFDRVEYVFEP